MKKEVIIAAGSINMFLMVNEILATNKPKQEHPDVFLATKKQESNHMFQQILNQAILNQTK